jgi:hypothetical protein
MRNRGGIGEFLHVWERANVKSVVSRSSPVAGPIMGNRADRRIRRFILGISGDFLKLSSRGRIGRYIPCRNVIACTVRSL